MGMAKAAMMEMQELQYEERRAEWIRREMSDDDADEATDGWQELSDQYDETVGAYQEFLEEQYVWYHDQDYSSAYVSFQQSIKDVESLLKSSLSPVIVGTVYKMAHIHMVTALEAYLGDTLKILVLNSDQYIANAAKNLKEIRELSLRPIQVFLDKNIVVKKITEQLSDYLYHDIPKVLRLYKACLDFDCSYDLKDVIPATKTRHDLVHRNGKRKDGSYITLELAQLRSSLTAIENFVQFLDKELLSYRG